MDILLLQNKTKRLAGRGCMQGSAKDNLHVGKMFWGSYKEVF